MRILIYTLNFDPEPTATGKYTGEMARWLARNGHDVSVIAGLPHYPEWKLYDGYHGNSKLNENIAGVSVMRVRHFIPDSVPPSPFSRVRMEVSFLFGSIRLWVRELLSRRRYDVVVVVCPPFFCSVAAIMYRFFRSVPWVYHIQDIQIDVALRLGMIKGRLLSHVLRWLEGRLLRSADAISTISYSMQQRLLDKTCGTKSVFVTRNWASSNVLDGRCSVDFKRLGNVPSDAFLLLYSGNIGFKQGVEVLLDLAEKCIGENIVLLVVGDGAAKLDMVEEAKKRNLSNIIFFPVQPVEAFPSILKTADVHLVVQKAEADGSVLPSKIANIFASGIPVIVTATKGSELCSIVEENRAGLVVDPENPEQLFDAVRELMHKNKLAKQLGRNAHSYALRNLDIEHVMPAFADRLASVASSCRR